MCGRVRASVGIQTLRGVGGSAYVSAHRGVGVYKGVCILDASWLYTVNSSSGLVDRSAVARRLNVYA